MIKNTQIKHLTILKQLRMLDKETKTRKESQNLKH